MMFIQDENIYKEITTIMWRDILEWGHTHMRYYPWRENPTGFKIIIAEILLHRTRANQVNKLYLSFIKKFPNFISIVKAGSEGIRQELYPLGLEWRSNLLYHMSKEIVDKYGGVLPLDKSKLMDLPGVGIYIASAVLCFGCNLPEPVLDTNTVRVIGRVFGIKIADSSRRSKKFERIMKDMTSLGEPRRFSLSLIDFAAKVCTPGKNPRCDKCPLTAICCFNKGEQDLYATRID